MRVQSGQLDPVFTIIRSGSVHGTTFRPWTASSEGFQATVNPSKFQNQKNLVLHESYLKDQGPDSYSGSAFRKRRPTYSWAADQMSDGVDCSIGGEGLCGCSALLKEQAIKSMHDCTQRAAVAACLKGKCRSTDHVA